MKLSHKITLSFITLSFVTSAAFVLVQNADAQTGIRSAVKDAGSSQKIKADQVRGGPTKGDSSAFSQTAPRGGKGASKNQMGGPRTLSTLGSKTAATKRVSSPFDYKFDPNQEPAWGNWIDPSSSDLPEKTAARTFDRFKKKYRDPTASLPSANRYQVRPDESAQSIADKADGMMGSLDKLIKNTSANLKLTDEDVQTGMLNSADAVYDATDEMYTDIDEMYKEIDRMYRKVDQNYASLEKYDNITTDLADQFNGASDAMADRVSGMILAVDGMLTRASADSATLQRLIKGLDGISQGGTDKKKYLNQLDQYVDDVDNQFSNIISTLEAKGTQVRGKDTEVRDYLKKAKSFNTKSKEFVDSDVSTLEEIKSYLQSAVEYLDTVTKDLEQTQEDLRSIETYFLKAKIQPNVPDAGGGDACSGAEPAGMQTKQACLASCRTICQWKKKVGGADCYACQQGGAQTCYDLGFLPANHSWCNGGICDTDPMLYCTPFGTIAPDNSKLSCTKCQQRPDMCWQKVQDGTTTLTNCKLGCRDGKCEYRGKYIEKEWNGRDEFIHCYECVYPPGPPTCEELQWGYDWEKDCLADCPAPGYCEEVLRKMGDKADDDKDGKDGKDGDDGGDGDGGDGGGGGGTGEKPEDEDDKKRDDSADDEARDEAEEDDLTGGLADKSVPDGEGEDVDFDTEKLGDDGLTDRPGDKPKGKDGKGDKPTGQDDKRSGKGTREGDQGGTDGTEGKKPKPPKGGPQDGDGGGATGLPGGGGQKPTDEPVTQDTEPPKAPAKPNKTAPRQPKKPTKKKPTITKKTPPKPPTNPEIKFLREWIEEDEKKIAERKKMLKDPKTGERTREQLKKSIKRLELEREELKKKLKLQEEIEIAKQAKKKAEEQAREAARAKRKTKERPKSTKQRLRELQLRDFKVSLEKLKKRAQEVKEILQSRQKTIDATQKKITQLEKEIEHFEDGIADETIDEDHAKTQIRKAKKRLAQHKANLKELQKKLKEAKDQYLKELEKLKTEVKRNLWAVDASSRQTEEINRIDEIFKRYDEYRRLLKTREVSNKAFDKAIKALESEIKKAKAKGEDTDDLEEELKNMKKGKKEWNALYDKRQTRMKKELDELMVRNGIDGVGPDNVQELKDQVGKYAKKFTDSIKTLEKARDRIKKAIKEGKLATSVDRYGNESTQELDVIEKKLKDLRSGLEVLKAKEKALSGEYTLDNEDVKNIKRTAQRVAQGSRKMGEGKSFVRQFGESLVEEVARTARPDIYLKKTLAFAVGTVKGVGTAIAGLVQLGLGAGDLLFEGVATGLGFDVETDAADTLMGALSTVSDNANLDGLVKASVAVGGLIDAELKKLEKSRDIDWDSAELGGKVLGETVVGDKAIGKLAKGTKALRGLGKADDLGKAGKGGTRVKGKDKIPDGSEFKTPDIGKTPPKGPDVGPVPPKTQPAPKGGKTAPKKPDKKPTARGPPEGPKKPLKKAKQLDNTKPLPKSKTKPKALADDAAKKLEKENGFQKEHAKRMHEFAQETDTFLIVRDGNPSSVKYFDKSDIMPKPMSAKAKTAKVGPDKGLVVDPTHPKQAKYWNEAIKEAAAKAIKTGDYSELDKLQKARKKALKSWKDYGADMKKKGYSVNKDSGVIEFTDPTTGKHWKGVHGDYDLHGVYKKGGDGSVSRASFGDGTNMADGEVLRKQLNQKLTGGKKDFVQHGAQDDWVPDPKKVPKKPPDPPATVFFPDGRPPKRLNTADEMKAFYENEMGVKWEYPDP